MSCTIYKVDVYEDGTEEWFNSGGHFHRENGPARIFPDGQKVWYKNGEFHREDGPAIVFPDGEKQWHRNGQLHREDGPSVVYANGTKEWHLNGIKYSEQEFLEKISEKSDPCDGKTVEIDGKKYKLSLID